MRRNKKDYDKIIDNYNRDEITYFNKLLPDTKDNIIKMEKNIMNISNEIVPSRFKFLLSNTTIENKRVIINKLNEINKLSSHSSEYSKLYKYINTLTKLPLGLYHNINIRKNDISDYLMNIKKELNEKIYGHNETKDQIIRILAQFIANPSARGYAIGIQGSMGVGKTKLIKDGIAKVLKYPTYGKIVDEIIKAQVMNPIFFFDELDKISSSRYGEEITNTLIHITDNTQNDNFSDKYLEEINLDLSKSLMFFTFNNIDNINPILRDRMIIIKVDKYSLSDKVKLCKNFLIKEICLSYNIKMDDIIIKDEDIEYLINRTTEEEGVRNLQRNINNIYSYINMNRYIKIDDKLITFPFTITKELINKYIIMKREDNLINLSLYL